MWTDATCQFLLSFVTSSVFAPISGCNVFLRPDATAELIVGPCKFACGKGYGSHAALECIGCAKYLPRKINHLAVSHFDTCAVLEQMIGQNGTPCKNFRDLAFYPDTCGRYSVCIFGLHVSRQHT